MNEKSDTKPKVARSPRAPILSLERALLRAQELHALARGHPALTADAMKHWGYAPKSSGGLQTIATLKLYGLVEDVGSGDTRKVQLTKEAINYLVDERPDRRAQARKDFALRPKILAGLWEVWQANPPGDSVARSQLRVDKGFNEKAANDVVKIYRENLQFAGLADETRSSEGDGLEEEEAPEIHVGDFIQWESGGQLQFKQPRRVTRVSDDGGYISVEGSSTGIPVDEVHRVEAPPPPPHQHLSPPIDPKGGYQVTLTEDRLQVNASVDKAGLKKLMRVLKAHLMLLENDDEKSAADEEGENAA